MQPKFRFWDGEKMIYNGYEHANCAFNGLLTCEGDTIPMQSLGLKDKNGKEIFESDVVRITDYFCQPDKMPAYLWIGGLRGTIEWMTSGFEFSACELYRDDLFLKILEENAGADVGDDEIDCNDLEIIGNIYENAYLLK